MLPFGSGKEVKEDRSVETRIEAFTLLVIETKFGAVFIPR